MKLKALRFFLPKAEDYAIWDNFETLAVLRGKNPAAELVKILDKYISDEDARKRLGHATWVNQIQLIERLEKDYGITTNTQTIRNYKKELKGLYFTDGSKHTRYNLELVAERFPRIQGKKLASSQKGKTK